MTEFVHLHNHTDYSLLDGAGSAKKYVKRAKELGMTALGITDHGNMFGVMPFYFACKKEGIQPIIGCEFYVAPEGRLNKAKENKEYNHLVLLAMNERGYHNLMELNSIAYIEGFYSHPRIDHECLAEHSEGLICMSACLAGELSQYFLNGQDDTAYETAKWYKNLFGDRYYIELQNHFIPEEITVLPMLVKLSHDLDIPLVATNDIHYTSKDDAVAHDILLCIGTKAKLEDKDRMQFATQEFYMKSSDEMNELFSEYPQAISNTVAIAGRCKFDITFPKGLLPDIDVPLQYESAADWLKTLTKEGLRKRYPTYETDQKLTGILDERIEKEWVSYLHLPYKKEFHNGH